MAENTPLTGLMARTSRLYKSTVNTVLAKNNTTLSSEMVGILLELYAREGQYLRDLSDRFKKDKGGINKLVNSLETRGLVYREKDELDQRRKKIMLTKKARTVQRDLIMLITEIRAETLKEIPEEERAITRKVLFKIIANLEEKR